MSWRRRLWARITRIVRRPGARPVVRFFTRLHGLVYRITGGRAQARSFPTLVLYVPGRSTGMIRATPLVYVKDEGAFVVAAAYSGADRNPSWWNNLQAAPTAEIQVGQTRITVRTDVVHGAEREQLWDKLCSMYPPFLDYTTHTTRVFPIARLTPIDDPPASEGGR